MNRKTWLTLRLSILPGAHCNALSATSAAMAVVRGFITGFLSTLVFRQGVLTLFWWSGIVPRAPYDMTRVPPLGVPAVICLAFWGGIWGVVLSPLLRHAKGAAYWTRAVLFGAIVPSAVGLFIVLPLKGMPVAGGWNPAVIIAALLLNGAWGLGVALLRQRFAA